MKAHQCETKSEQRPEFLRGMRTEPALFPPGHTPAYSNNGFTVLGIVIERIYGTGYAHLLQNALLDKLGMRHTSATVPSITTDSIIPSSATESGWDNEIGALAAYVRLLRLLLRL